MENGISGGEKIVAKVADHRHEFWNTKKSNGGGGDQESEKDEVFEA